RLDDRRSAALREIEVVGVAGDVVRVTVNAEAPLRVFAHDGRDLAQGVRGLRTDRIAVEGEVDAVDLGLAGFLQRLLEGCHRSRSALGQRCARTHIAGACTGAWLLRRRASMGDLDDLQGVAIAALFEAL